MFFYKRYRFFYLLTLTFVIAACSYNEIYAKTQVIPLPAFSTNPNEGETYGVLPVWLFLNKEHKIKAMFAPSVTYNNIYGLTGTLRFFGFPAGGRKYEFILGRSTEHDQTIKLSFSDPNIFNDSYSFTSEMKYINDISYRFYGIGPDTKPENESNYTHNELKWYGKFTAQIFEKIDLSLQERVSKVLVKPGKVDKLPFSKDKFSDVPGMNRALTWAHKASVTFDSRDKQEQATQGFYLDLFTEFAQKVLDTDTSFLKYGIETKKFIPFIDKKFILVLRGLFEKQDGHDIPFYERSRLGGDDTLRGYGANRFFDNNRVLFSAEQRIHLFTLNIFNVKSEWEVAPFVEVGRVFDSYRLPLFKDFKVVSGVGVRAIVRPNVVGRVDIGIGGEGVKVFVGLGYPF